MKNHKPSSETSLRRRAEARLRTWKQTVSTAVAQPPAAAEPSRLLHELQVRQVELELQNEELSRAKAELESALERYAALYDFAPVAYFSLRPDGTIRQVNLTGARLLGTERSGLVNRPFPLFVAEESRPAFKAFLSRVLTVQTMESCELSLRHEGLPPRVVRVEATAVQSGQECQAVVTDLTDDKRLEEERELTLRLLDRINTSHDLRTLMREVTLLLREATGCEAVGIRLRDGEDFPYFETAGFPAAFVRAEDRLCEQDEHGQLQRDGQGHPVLACMCGNVLRGRFDATQPFFTARGSFWTNSTTRLLASTTETDRQARTRNGCHGEGYESVALVALRTGGETFGLLQFNDRRPGRFTRERIAHLEGLANHLAISLARWRAEEARRESEARLLQATIGSNIGLWDWDLRSNQVYYSPIWKSQIGYEDHEISNRFEEWQSRVHPDDLERALATVRAFVANPWPNYELEIRFLHKDGSYRWILAKADVLRDEVGRPYRMLGSHLDITERKRVEAELRLSEERFRTLAGMAPVGLYLTDLEGRCLYANPRWCEIAGLRLEEALGEGWVRGVHPEDRASVVSAWQRMVASEGRWGHEYRFQTPAGKVTWVQGLAVPQRDAAGRIVGYVGINIDITERKLDEEHLRAFQGQLRSLAAELSRVEQRERRCLATLLHDDVIQALALSNIKLGALRESLPLAEQRSAVEAIRALLEQAIRSSRSLTFQLSPPMLHELGLEPALDWLAEQFTQEHGLACEFRSDGQSKPLEEEVLPVLFTATRELLFNVVKHARATRATVSSIREDDLICLLVTDDGVGFDPAQVRGRSGQTGGFGLFNVRERLSYLGGSCEVESAPGQGTRVVLRAPLKREQVEKAP